MNDANGLRIEAAEQFGFEETTGAVDGYICTEAQLIAFAKACERKGLAEAASIAGRELRNVSLLLSNPPKSSAAWDIRNAINKRVETIDAELALGATHCDPVAWSYELATARYWRDCVPGEYCNFEPRVSRDKPNVPSGSIRNLRPLYAGAVESDQ